jgi:NAD-dependent SIR2 family protein deacetylase
MNPSGRPKGEYRSAQREGSPVSELREFVARHPRLFVLSGAGVSTASGIPGYRDEAGAWKRSPPVTVQEFVKTGHARRRYWARSMIGWRIMGRAEPNAAHAALARLEAQGRVELLVTQNVDGLHQRAGSANVVELHGNVGRVICLDCGAACTRAALQGELEAANPAFVDAIAEAAPDGDADVEPADLDAFNVPACERCGGMLKPDVVFFGEGVPRDRVASAFAALAAADAMLVVGSSLMVWSGYRFCERAKELARPIAAINLGRTRADALLALKIEAPCADALSALTESLAVA